jgi:hypothetical protein
MQLARIEKPQGSKPIAIEVDGEPKGVVVPDSRGFRFLAVKFDAFAVDGQVFETVQQAEDAVRTVVRA